MLGHENKNIKMSKMCISNTCNHILAVLTKIVVILINKNVDILYRSVTITFTIYRTYN